MNSEFAVAKQHRTRLLLLLIGVLLQHVFVMVLPRAFAVHFSYPPLVVVNIGAYFFAKKTSESFAGRSQLAWKLIGYSRLVQAFGWLVYEYYEVIRHVEHPVGNLGDFCVILADVLVIVSFGVLMTERSTRENWIKTLLDGLTVGVAYFLLTWMLFLRSASTQAHKATATAIAGVAAGSLFVVVNIFCVAFAFLVLTRDRPSNTTPRRAITLIGAGVLLHSLTLIGYTNWQAQGVFGQAHLFAPAYLDATLFICAAAWRARSRRSEVDEMLSVAKRAYSATLLVMALIAITGPMQFIVGSKKTDSVSVGFGAFMVGLVILRQLLLLNENVTLNEDLESRVEKRTDELMEREQRFRALVTNSSDVITILDDAGIVKYVSPSVQQVFGYRPDSWIDWRLSIHVEPDDARVLDGAIDLARSTPGEPIDVEWSIRHRDGTMCKVESSVTALLHEPSVQGIVLNTRDVSERRALEHRLRHQASHDALTGLANRALFKTRMGSLLDRSRRGEGTFALLFCDLDEFKSINDSLGHAVGDEVLVEIARRLRSCVRPGDTVARLGGDEFAVILEHIDSDDDAAWIAERIKTEIARPFDVRERQMFVGVSVGIATSFNEYEHLDDLLAKADIAMYMAKSRGKGNHVRFDPEMHEQILRQLALEEDLRRAVENDQLVVYYQPIHDLGSEKVVSFEALVRWVHPEQGLIPPNDFIPLAEQTGIIDEIGAWVLTQACMQLRDWQVQYPNDPPLAMSVNLSGHQLQDATLAEQIGTIISETGINPKTLTLEMTESVLLEDADAVVIQLEALRSLGVRLAIDDFGTGYSSLSYLRHFPVDVLKIDRSFVKGLGTATQDLALVQAIMSLGEVMHLDTVAEGIETISELNELQKIGCHLGQGYLFAKPAPSREISKLLGKSNSKIGSTDSHK